MPQALKWHFKQNNKELRHSCTYSAIFIFLGGGGLKFAVNLGIVFRRGRSFGLGLIEIRTCLHKKCVRIFEHNFVADKAKIRRRAVARQGFLTQSAAKFAEKTYAYAYEDRF